MRVPPHLGSERRRSASVRPPSILDDKDTRRRRRLSELAGGIFYSETPVTHAHDNLAMEAEGLPGEKQSSKLEPISDSHITETSTC